MSIRSEPIAKDEKAPARKWRRISEYRIASAITWALSTSLTYLFLTSLKSVPLGVIGAAGVAIVVQAVCTLAERPLWRWLLNRRGGRFVLASVGITLIDGGLNAAGLYPYMGALGTSNVAAMFAEVFNTTPEISPRVAFALAAAFGLVLAGLPEMLWELDDGG